MEYEFFPREGGKSISHNSKNNGSRSSNTNLSLTEVTVTGEASPATNTTNFLDLYVIFDEQRNSTLGVVIFVLGTRRSISSIPPRIFPTGFWSRRRGVIRYGRLNLMELQTVDNAQIQICVKILVTCYQVYDLFVFSFIM